MPAATTAFAGTGGMVATDTRASITGVGTMAAIMGGTFMGIADITGGTTMGAITTAGVLGRRGSWAA